MSPRLQAAAGTAATVCLVSSPAYAHAPIPGFEGFYVGLVHPLSTAAQILAILALGLMLGLRFRQGLPVLLALAGGLVVGMGYGQWQTGPDWVETALLFTAIASATISALFPTGRQWFVILVAKGMVACVAGVLLGVVSTPDPGPWGAVLITLTGSFVGVVLVPFYIGMGISWLREKFSQHWIDIGIRVVAAWIGAIAILMAALSFAETPVSVKSFLFLPNHLSVLVL